MISDMAPNMSGMNAVDQPRSMYLVELALDMARQVLGHLEGHLWPKYSRERASMPADS